MIDTVINFLAASGIVLLSVILIYYMIAKNRAIKEDRSHLDSVEVTDIAIFHTLKSILSIAISDYKEGTSMSDWLLVDEKFVFFSYGNIPVEPIYCLKNFVNSRAFFINTSISQVSFSDGNKTKKFSTQVENKFKFNLAKNELEVLNNLCLELIYQDAVYKDNKDANMLEDNLKSCIAKYSNKYRIVE
jgi:hypothetical protein